MGTITREQIVEVLLRRIGDIGGDTEREWAESVGDVLVEEFELNQRDGFEGVLGPVTRS